MKWKMLVDVIFALYTDCRDMEIKDSAIALQAYSFEVIKRPTCFPCDCELSFLVKTEKQAVLMQHKR